MLTAKQEQWLAALESGEFEQARKTLRDPASPAAFCCLGLGCHLEDPQAWRVQPLSRPGRFEFGPRYKAGNNRKTGDWQMLPKAVQESYGFASCNAQAPLSDIAPDNPDRPAIKALNARKRRGGGTTIALTELNDAGWPFARIAALVRRSPRAFFTSIPYPEDEPCS